MHRIAKLGVIGLMVVGMLGLSACAPERYDTSNENLWPVREVSISLKDGRTLPCVKIYQGLSCDWQTANKIGPVK